MSHKILSRISFILFQQTCSPLNGLLQPCPLTGVPRPKQEPTIFGGRSEYKVTGWQMSSRNSNIGA